MEAICKYSGLIFSAAGMHDGADNPKSESPAQRKSRVDYEHIAIFMLKQVSVSMKISENLIFG